MVNILQTENISYNGSPVETSFQLSLSIPYFSITVLQTKYKISIIFTQSSTQNLWMYVPLQNMPTGVALWLHFPIKVYKFVFQESKPSLFVLFCFLPSTMKPHLDRFRELSEWSHVWRFREFQYSLHPCHTFFLQLFTDTREISASVMPELNFFQGTSILRCLYSILGG